MRGEARTILILLSALAVLAAGVGWPVQARPAPDAPPTTSTTVSLLEDLLNKLLPTTVPPPTTTVPVAASPPAPPSGPGPQPVAPTPSPTSIDQASCAPPEAPAGSALSGSTSGPRDTAPLLDALGRLTGLGLPLDELVVLGMGRFPVGGRAEYTNDWLAPRFTPCFHLHKGTDIFADRGTPVRAPDDGVVRLAEEAVGGKVAGITAADGTYYYLAHLEGFRPGLPSGARVARGEVVGFVGTSGNAAGGSPHAHFQVHPRGGAPVNPKPMLDAWLDQALADAPKLIVPTPASVPRPFAALLVARRLDEVSVRAAADGSAERADEWDRADQLAQAILAPLTHRVLESVLTEGP